MVAAAAAAATGSAVGAALAGVVPAGFLFKPAAGDALVVGSLAFSFNEDGDVAFSGDDLRCAAAPVLELLADNRGRRTVLEALVGAECVNLGAGRAVKVFVMVVVVVVVMWLAEPLIDVADLTRMLLLVAVDELADLATPLASGLLGLRAPVMGPVAGAVLRIVDANVLRGEGTFGLAAALLAPKVPDVVGGLLAVTCGRGFTWEAPVVPAAAVPLPEVDAGLRIAEVVVVVRVAVAAVLGLLAESLLAGAVAGRVPAVLLPVDLGVDLAAALLEARGLRAAVLVGLAAPVAVVVDVVEAVVLGAVAVRGRAVAAAGLGAAVLPRDVFLVRAPAAAVGLALAADVAVVEAVFAAGFLVASPGEVLSLGLEITAVAATAAAAATAATATSATGASSLGCSSATISAGSRGFSSETASGICSVSFSASGSATIGSTTAIAGCASCGGSEVSLLAWPLV